MSLSPLYIRPRSLLFYLPFHWSWLPHKGWSYRNSPVTRNGSVGRDSLENLPVWVFFIFIFIFYFFNNIGVKVIRHRRIIRKMRFVGISEFYPTEVVLVMGLPNPPECRPPRSSTMRDLSHVTNRRNDSKFQLSGCTCEGF